MDNSKGKDTMTEQQFMTSFMDEAITMVKDGAKFLANLVKMGVAGVPMAVNFDITYKCNLRCEHCYYWTSVKQLGIRPWELSDNQWQDVFKYYARLGVENVSLTGGEPTLRMNIIEMAHHHFPRVQTATNGIIRIPENVQPRGIWLSIDGPQEIHDKIRGSPKCFQRLMENYQDDPRVAVSSTISSTNYLHVDNIVKTCIDLGVKGVFFMLYSGLPEDPLFLTGKNYSVAMQAIGKAIREYPDFVLITEDMLQAYHSKGFIKTCPFLGSRPGVVSFYADMTRKRCVMGDNVDCATCSCIVPVGAYCLQHKFLNFENYRKITRILG